MWLRWVASALAAVILGRIDDSICCGQSAAVAEPAQNQAGPADPIRAEQGLIESGREQHDSPADTSAAAEAVLPTSLTVADVIASVYRFYPEINQAKQQSQLAAGQLLATRGAYDIKLYGHTLSEPTGFYENYRHGIGVARRMWWGGNVAAGYRLGRGVFQPWYRERETEKGGEFKVAMNQPLLRGRAIDPQRFALFQASLARRAADPILQEAILKTSRDALIAYWDWVSAGAVLQAQRQLLQFARTRGEQYRLGFEAGKFAEIDVVLNQQVIAERSTKAIESERKFRAAALKLSLFLRDDAGQPLLPDDDWLPSRFPKIQPLPETDIENEVALALRRRPELRQLEIELQGLDIDRRLARNQILPRLDFVIEGSQDVGQPGSPSDDKGDFVLVIGAASDVPVQRRRARGKLQATSAKITQLNQKLQLQKDKIGIELRTAFTSLALTAQAVQQAELSFQAAVDTLQRYRFAFDRGKIDLIYLNLFETRANESEILLIEAQREWFAELADYQAAAGLDPLDQASVLSQLPQSPETGRLDPQMQEPDAAKLDQDWQLRIGAPN